MAEHSSCLGEAQAECVVQPGSKPLRMGADLTGSRPEGIRGLPGVSSLDTPVTAPTAPDTDGEAGDDRSHFEQLGMELFSSRSWSTTSPQSGHDVGSGAESSWSTGPDGVIRWPWRPWSLPDL